MATFFIRGQRDLIDRIKDLDRAVQEKLAVLVASSAKAIQTNAERRAPRDTGRLASSMTTELIQYKGGAFLTARVKALPFYIYPVEFGYKGRSGRGNRGHRMPLKKVGGKWQVVEALAQWAERHGRSPWAVAKNLLKKGHPPQPFFFKSMDEEKEHFLERLREIVDKEAPASLGPPPNPASGSS